MSLCSVKKGVFMDINVLAERTGLSKENILFYERKLYILPERDEKGYSIYSEKDIEILLKVKLLRSLYVSRGDTGKIIKGKKTFQQILKKKITELSNTVERMKPAYETITMMLQDEAEFKNLDTEKYLAYLESVSEDGYIREVLPEDRNRNDSSSWARYFARGIDLTIWTVLEIIILPEWIITFVNKDSAQGFAAGIVFGLIELLLIIFVEPLFLAKFKTTPGKALLGIKIQHEDGSALSYMEGVRRTLNLAFYGLGLGIPFVSLITMISSYSKYSHGEESVWNVKTGAVIDYRKMSDSRIWIGVIIYIVISIGTDLI